MTTFSRSGLEKKSSGRAIIKKVATLLFYILVAAFLIFYLQDLDFSKLKDVHLSWLYLIIATILALLSRYFGTYIWFVLLSSLGAKGLRRILPDLIYVYAKSWLGRYIPGTAPWILGKIYFASRHGVSKNKLAVSSLLEGGLKIVVTMAIGFVMLIFDKRLGVIALEVKLIMVTVLLVCIISIIPTVFNFILSFIYKLLRKKSLPQRDQATGATVIRGALLYTLGSLINGLSFFFIAKAVYPNLNYNDLLFVMGAGNLSMAASMLAIFVPSGIGIREGIQLVLLGVIMPLEFALIITVATRLWSVVVDLIFFASSRVYLHANSRDTKSADDAY